MTETVHSASATGSPASGWYPDPGGSGGMRWWSGQGWTESLQLPAPPAPPTEPAPPAPPPVPPLAPAAYVVTTPEPPAAVSQFGGPAVPFGTPAPATHRAAGRAQPDPSAPTRSKALLVGIGVGALVVVAGAVLLVSKLLSGGGDAAPTAGTAGPRGPAALASAKSDARTLATAEETFFTDRQAYVALPASSDIVELGQTVVHLSPQNTASVILNGSGTGYCIRVVSTSPTSGASSAVVYVSTLGGEQPSLVTTCPSTF